MFRSAVGLCTVAMLCPALAWADQFVAMDETWEHAADLPDSHYRVKPSAQTPDDWTSPVDYSDGTAWVYLEVQTKPTEQETKFQVCFEATPTYACTAQSPTYTEIGTYEWPTPFSDFWSPPNEYVDWTQGVNKLANILKDTMNNKPSTDNVGEETAALYMPTRVRLVVTIVSAGGTYVPPTPTGEAEGGGGSGPVAGNGAGGAGGAGDGGAPAAATGGSAASTGGSNDGGAGGSTATSEDDGCAVSRGARDPNDRHNHGAAYPALALGFAALLRRRFIRAQPVRIPASWLPARRTRLKLTRPPRKMM
jgi:MYXO-CTERM domain-containing protein